MDDVQFENDLATNKHLIFFDSRGYESLKYLENTL